MTAEGSVSHKYIKRISFDNLAPTFIDDQIRLLKENDRHISYTNRYYHIPPQYNPYYSNSEHTKSANQRSSAHEHEEEPRGRPSLQRSGGLDYRAVSQPAVPQVNEFLGPPTPRYSYSPRRGRSPGGVRSRSTSPFSSSPMRDRRVGTFGARLPPPPDISILKKNTKCVVEEEPVEDIDIADMDLVHEKRLTQLTNENTRQNAGSKKGYTQSLFSHLNEVEDRFSSKRRAALNDEGDEASSNRPARSFAHMSNEELAALEDFYSSGGRQSTISSRMNSFDFMAPISPTTDSGDNLVAGSFLPPSNGRQKGINNLIADSLNCVYPSRPSVTYQALSLTIQNKDFASHVSKVQAAENAPLMKESSSLRIISCYISGRRYTWSSVDFYIENMAKDGDHLVIVSTIPNFEEKLAEKRMESESRRSNIGGLTSPLSSSSRRKSEDDHTLGGSKYWRERGVPTGEKIEAIYEEAKEVCRHILYYYSKRLAHKNVKITVELVKDNSTKNAITMVSAVYKPKLHIVSTVSTNIQIKFRNSNVKLPFFLMRHYAIPVIIVPYEFINQNLLIEDREKPKTKVSKDDRLEWLSEAVERTLTNPYLKSENFSYYDSPLIHSEHSGNNDEKRLHHRHHHHHGRRHDRRVADSDESECSEYSNDSEESEDSGDDENDADTVSDYFPMSYEQRKNKELFEQLGYVAPKSTREILLAKNDVFYNRDGKKITASITKGSRRGSRMQIGDIGLYQVKSLIDGPKVPTATTPRSGRHLSVTNAPSLAKVKTISAPGGVAPVTTSRSGSHGYVLSKVKKQTQQQALQSKSAENSSLQLSKCRTTEARKRHTQLSPHQSTASTRNVSPIRSTLSRSSHSSDSRKEATAPKTKKKSGFGSMFRKVFG